MTAISLDSQTQSLEDKLNALHDNDADIKSALDSIVSKLNTLGTKLNADTGVTDEDYAADFASVGTLNTSKGT